jgi:hypothetical protein
LLLGCAIAVASGCAQLQPFPHRDPIKQLNNLMDSSGYFFPRPQPNEGDVYGAAFVRDPSVIKGNELPAIQGAQAYGKRMLEGAAAARGCAESPDPDTATACKEFVTKFCDRAQSAFELSQDETDWWRANSTTFQKESAGAKSINRPPKFIPQTRVVACGIDKIQVVHGYDVGGTNQIARSVAAKKPNAKAAAPVAPRNTSAIAAAVPAPKEAKSVVAAAPLPKKIESATLAALPAAPKQESAHPSKVAPPAARAKAVTSPLQIPNAGGAGVSRKAPPKGSPVAAVSSDSNTVESQTKRQDSKSTPTHAAIGSVVTGTFGGQLFGYSGGHSFSSDLILTLVAAGKEVKGAWIAEQGKSGKVTGTLAGSKIATMRLEQLEPCAGSYDGSAVIVEDGSRLRGSYTGTDCKGQVDASFIVVRR